MSEGNLLSEEITQRLLHEIREGCYANCRKLPPELTLAKEMGVSRTLIRDCLSALEREGFISRKHGVGTIVNPHILNATTRMDLEKEFLEMVSDAGYVSDMKIERIDKIPAEKEVAARLHIEEGDLVLISERLVTADDGRRFTVWIILRRPMPKRVMISSFLRSRCLSLLNSAVNRRFIWI